MLFQPQAAPMLVLDGKSVGVPLFHAGVTMILSLKSIAFLHTTVHM